MNKSDWQRERRNSRKRFVNQIKAGQACVDCGGTFPIICMDFDHRPGEVKVRDVAKMVNDRAPYKQIEEEIAKCDLVCSNCHRIRTALRGEWDIPE